MGHPQKPGGQKTGIMKSLRRHHSHGTPPIQEKKTTPFFTGPAGAIQAREGAPFFQAKLAIGKPGDQYEQEADAVADAVVGGNVQAPVVQKQAITPIQRATLATPADDEKLSTAEARMEKDKLVQEKPELQRLAAPEEEEEPVQMQAAEEEEPVQMRAEEEEEPVQAKHQADTSPQVASNDLAAQLQLSQGNGQPLPDRTRSDMETAFGVDFSGVHVHTDTQAIQMNRELGAQAFTHGSDVYFNSEKFDPEASDGKHLLAHELTHVVQQGATQALRMKKLTEEDKKADLQSSPLKESGRLQKAFDNSPAMFRGEKSEDVKIVQRILKEKLGYPMTVSFAKTGDADGIFGKETHDTIYQFQNDYGLEEKDGIAGRETLGKFDEILGGGAGPSEKCNIDFSSGTFSPSEQEAFLRKHFAGPNLPFARRILNDLCEVETDKLSFTTEEELRSEIFKRVRVSQLMQESQLGGAFGYPESKPAHCPGAPTDVNENAQVNTAAQPLWNKEIDRGLYVFRLNDEGKKDAYNAMKLLFTSQSSFCDRTLIHCDYIVTIIKSMAYAENIGVEKFNEKIRSGLLTVHITWHGMAIGGSSELTPSGTEYMAVSPASEKDLLIGDQVIFWNHLGYDSLTLKDPGPWRLENAVVVDKDASGADLFEGHGAPEVNHLVQPGKKEEVLDDLVNVYNGHVEQATNITDRIDAGDATAETERLNKFPTVQKEAGNWVIQELAKNSYRPRSRYSLKKLSGVNDPELVGLHSETDSSKMGVVKRPIESKELAP